LADVRELAPPPPVAAFAVVPFTPLPVCRGVIVPVFDREKGSIESEDDEEAIVVEDVDRLGWTMLLTI
jgi:hypothetical protein